MASKRPPFFDDPICVTCGDPQSRHIGSEMNGNGDCNVASCDCRGFVEEIRPNFEEMLQRLVLAESVTIPAAGARVLCKYALELEKRAKALCKVAVRAELKLERYSFMAFPGFRPTEALRSDLRNSIEALREILPKEVPDGKS